jgi:ACT domain-containing protein
MNSYYFDDYKITEFSYFEYKNLVKNLLSTEEDKLVNIFEEIIKKHVTVDRNLNIGEKIKILLLLRSMTLGEEISISLNNRIFNYDINKIIDSININKNIIIIKKYDLRRRNFYKFK